MPSLKPLGAFAVVALFASGFGAYGADSGSTSGSTAGTPMKMDEPMPTRMAKPGMKKGDVKKAAEKKDREMKAMMDRESAAGAGK
jgi:hypothetical protein